MKLKFVARFGYGDALPIDEVQEGPYRVFGSNGPYASLSRPNTEAPAIIIGRKGSYGKVNWTSAPCFASDTTFFIDASMTSHDLRWVYWLLQTLHLDEGTDEAAVPGLNRESAYSKEVICPSRQFQSAISNYLDRETAQLDALIAAKEHLLELLAEKRRALITRAVTRGIDPTAPLRDSGLPWLGEIPGHWSVRRLKYLSTIYYGLSQPPEYQSEGFPFLRATNVERGKINAAGLVYVSADDLPEARTVRLQAGDIIVVRSGAHRRFRIGNS
jgi:type I restriction enzyme S subunit